MRHYGSMARNVAYMAHMNNFWEDMYLGELIYGKIWLPKVNIINMVEVFVPTLIMDSKKVALGRFIFDLEIVVSQGKVVEVQMGSCDQSNIQEIEASIN